MKTLRWSEASYSDLSALLDSLQSVDPVKANKNLVAILAAPMPLLEHPYLGPEVGHHGARKWPVRGTQLLLLYSVTADNIRIDRIVDARSDWGSLL